MKSGSASSGPPPRLSGPVTAATATALRAGSGRPSVVVTSTIGDSLFSGAVVPVTVGGAVEVEEFAVLAAASSAHGQEGDRADQ